MPTDDRARARITLSSVRDAYFRGEFERVLMLADGFRPRDEVDIVENALLCVRALLALNRAEEALATLRSLRLIERPRDEYLTAQMLTGVAYTKLDQVHRAVTILGETYASAASAHKTVRAEIALYLGIAHYRRGEHADAERALHQVPAESDIVHAHALEYLGWTAYARGEYENAASLFTDALARVKACRNYDRFVEVATLFGLAHLVAELPRLERWPGVRARIRAIDWTAPGLNVPHFWLAIMSSFVEELLGDRAEAERWASLAEEIAPTAACRVVAFCRLSAVFGRYGESGAHRYFVRKARHLYDELPRDAAFRSEHALTLAVAEEISTSDKPLDAAPLLIFHREVVEPLVKQGPEHVKLRGIRDSVEAQLDLARGNRARAVRRFTHAFEAFDGIGYRRRAAILAYRLAELTGELKFREYASDALEDAGEAYWVKAALARLAVGEPRLTERHAAILRLVAEGKTNKEIAAARGISPLTARNTVRELLQRFRATNRTELGRLARERGLG